MTNGASLHMWVSERCRCKSLHAQLLSPWSKGMALARPSCRCLGVGHLAVFFCALEAWSWREVGLVGTCAFALGEHLHDDGVIVVLELDGVHRHCAHDAWR